MRLNQKPMRSISFLVTTTFFFTVGIQAQEELASRIKIDGVSAVIGDYVI